MNLSQLGPLVHALIAILPLAWNYAFHTSQPFSPGLILLCAFLGLLPDIDTQSSYIGRIFPEVSRFIERKYGHRTITHSLLALFLIGFLTRLLTVDWWLFTAAYGSHIILDMIVGGRAGVMLLWPLPQRFNFFSIPPASIAELTIGILAALFVIIPFTMPSTAVRIQSVLPLPPTFTPTRLPTATPAPIPTLVSIKIDHVLDPSEILVSAGQPITKGALLADLANYRATLTAPNIWELLPSPTPTPQSTATPWIAPTLDPLIHSAAVADLQSAIARATLAAAPPSIEEINRICDQVQTLQSKLEAMRNNLWQDQLARDATKIKANEPGANIPWEQIGAMEAGLAEQERQIAEVEHTQLPTAITECDTIRAKPHAASEEQLAVSAAELQRAHARYAQLIAAPPSPTPGPTHTPHPTATWTPTPDTTDTRIYSAVNGQVYDINIIAMDGLANTVKIDIAIGWGIPGSPSSAQPPSDQPQRGDLRYPTGSALGTVTHVRDGDTLEVQYADGSQATIRLLDVNTPETVKPNAPIECYGPEASHHTKERFQCDEAGNNCAAPAVQLETAGTDKYGRTLGYIWIEETLYNEELTAQGFAEYNDYGEKHQHSDRVEQAATLAQNRSVGLWSACSTQPSE